MGNSDLTKILIIDDESEVRDLLSILLRSYQGAEVVGEASDVDQGIQLTVETNPDLILLDIQMPVKDGFTFLDELKELNKYPGIIFVTAHENYAIRAIKNAAFDYILKPIEKKELFSSIDRFREVKKRNTDDNLGELINLLNNSRPGRIKLNTRTGYIFVDPDEIFLIEADGNYSHIMQISGKTEISTLSLGNLEKMLESETFLRVSRSFIINMKYISRVERKTNICELEYNGITHQIKIPSHKVKILEGYF